MAIEIQPEQRHGPGGPAHAQRQRSWFLRPGIHTGLVGAVVGYALGHFLGNAIGHTFTPLTLNDSSDMPIVFGYAIMVVGWLVGLAVSKDPWRLLWGGPFALADPNAGAATG